MIIGENMKLICEKESEVANTLNSKRGKAYIDIYKETDFKGLGILIDEELNIYKYGWGLNFNKEKRIIIFRIALLSRWHTHSHKPDERYLKEFLGLPDCKVTCVWDENKEVAKEWAAEWNVEAVFDLETLLSRDDVDGVMVTSCATDHRKIFIAAAEHKKHVFTEKVLSFTLEDAYAIRDAVKKNGIKFCISFNRLAIKAPIPHIPMILTADDEFILQTKPRVRPILPAVATLVQNERHKIM